MIIKKLGLFVLWCICIILGLKALTHAFSETVGIVIIVCVVIVADIVRDISIDMNGGSERELIC